LFKNIYDNLEFFELYLKEANIISEQSYLDNIISYNHDKMVTLLNKIHVQNPFYEFPIQMLHENQKLIRDKIHPQLPPIKVTFNKITKDTISLFVENKIDFPIEIHYLKYNSKKEILPASRILLKANYKTEYINQNIAIPLNNHINTSEFSYDSLEVYYSILGINKINKTIVFPIEMTEIDYLSLNPTTQPANINEFPFLIVNDNAKWIEFPDEKCEIQEDLMIPKGYIVSAKPGCHINLTNSSKIISYSPLLFIGDNNNLIYVTSSDSTGQGIVVFGCERISELSYVSFENLSSISDFGWDLKGAITFYESPVNINNCTFSNNLRGDDYLNIVRTNFNILNTSFTNINADAFDSDYCTGTIKNVKFLQVGNDAVDISGTMLKINDVLMNNIGDKGLSAGENSQIIANNLKISDSEIAICSKDMSEIIVSDVNLKNNNIGFTAFQKKSEFGPGSIKGSKVEMINTSIPYLIETQSNCTINGEIKKPASYKVKDVLYGVKYGKSSKKEVVSFN
jgi:hypothetical protein